MNLSISENNGLNLLTNDDKIIYSIGISTAGVAELEMVKDDNTRKVIATTIDQKGAEFATDFITKNNKTKQIEVKIEDISQPLPYPDNYFDFIYARLVLHYLSKDVLDKTLLEIKRVLKKDKKLFIVVRSTKCDDAISPNSIYDPTTHLTKIFYKEGNSNFRYFHDKESISNHITQAGFKIGYVKSFDEGLFQDFNRTIKSDKHDNLIELVTVK